MGAWLDSFLRVVVDQRASDLHLHAGKPPIVRLDGDLVALPFRELGDADTRRFIWQVLDDKQRAALDTDLQLDFIYVLEGVGRFRANAFMQRDGLSAVFRVIPERLPTMKELRLPMSVRALTRHQNGLVLVTGPTGSGKTTTLASTSLSTASSRSAPSARTSRASPLVCARPCERLPTCSWSESFVIRRR